MFDLTQAEKATIFLQLLAAMEVPADPRRPDDIARHAHADAVAFHYSDLAEIHFRADQLEQASHAADEIRRTGKVVASAVDFNTLAYAMGGHDIARLACEIAGFAPGSDSLWVDYTGTDNIIKLDVAGIEAAR